MLLRSLAKDLYASQKEVEMLGQQLESTVTNEDKEKVKEDLRQATAELSQIRKVMEGRKEQSRASLYKVKSRF